MASSELNDLYGDAILDHCRHPRNPDVIEDPTGSGNAVNPFCGDEVALQFVIEDGRVSQVGVQSKGCSINQASASMLSEALANKSADEIAQLAKRFREALQGSGPTPEQLERLGPLRALVGVREFPVRIKCALLPLSAIEDALEGRH